MDGKRYARRDIAMIAKDRRHHTAVGLAPRRRRGHGAAAMGRLSILLAMACCFWRAEALKDDVGSIGENCIFSIVLDEDHAGSEAVASTVSNTLDGVPSADAQCPSGYGGLLFELSLPGGGIRGLFIDFAVGYGYLDSLDDYGPTLIGWDKASTLGTISLGYEDVDSVDDLLVAEGRGAFDLGISIECAECSARDDVSEVSLRVVGCELTVEHVVFGRLGVVASTVGDISTDKGYDFYTFGYGRAVPEGCVVDEKLAETDTDHELARASVDPDEDYDVAHFDLNKVVRKSAASSSPLVDISRDTAIIEHSRDGLGGGITGVERYLASSWPNTSENVAGEERSTPRALAGDYEWGPDQAGSWSAVSTGGDTTGGSTSDEESTSELCGELSNELSTDDKSMVVAISELNPLSYTTSTDDCSYHTISVVLDSWAGSNIKAAFFDLENEDLDDLDVRAEVVSPSDGSVTVSSEKVDENRLSSIDGYDSKSGGFDFAVAFDGDSAYIQVDLTACGLMVNSFAAHRATVVVTYEGETSNLSSYYLDCILHDAITPAPSSTRTLAPTPTVSPTVAMASSAPVVTAAPSVSPQQATPPPSSAPSPVSLSYSPSESPTAAPTLGATASPTTPAKVERGSSITGTLQVSGLDPAVGEEEVYENCRDGLAQAFGVNPDTAVTVAPPGLVPTYDDDYYYDDDAQARRRRGRRRRRLGDSQSNQQRQHQEGSIAVADELHRAGDVSRTVSGEPERGTENRGTMGQGDEEEGRIFYGTAEEAEIRDSFWENGVTAWDESGADSEKHGELSISSRERRRGHRRQRDRQHSARPRHHLRRLSSSSSTSSVARELQTDDGDYDDDASSSTGIETNTMNVSFSVLLPDQGEGDESASSTSSQGRWTPSQRVAAAVEAYAEGGGRAALADALGVSASNVSMTDLQYCASAGACNTTTLVVSENQSVVEELGTSGPWERFLEDIGGLLILALFGTCCVSICLWVICYRILFYGTDELDHSDAVKPHGARRHADESSVSGQGRSSSGKFEMSRRPNSLGRGGSNRSTSSQQSGGIQPTSTVPGDGKENEANVDGMEAGNGSGGSGSGGSAGSGHWTSSQFGRMHSSDEYHAQNPLRSSEAGSAASRSSLSHKSSSRNRFSLVTSKSYKDDFALESVGYDGGYKEREEGEIKTTNPMFLGRDIGSPLDDSPSPQGSPAAIIDSSSLSANNVRTAAAAPTGDATAAAGTSIGRRPALSAFGGAANASGTGSSRSPLRSSQNQMESPIAMLSERTSSDSTGDENTPDAAKTPDDGLGGRFGAPPAMTPGVSSSGSPNDTEDSGFGVAGGSERGRARMAAAGAATAAGDFVGSVDTGRRSQSPAGDRGEDVGMGGYGVQTLYGELQDVSPSLSPGITSASDTESAGAGEEGAPREAEKGEGVRRDELGQQREHERSDLRHSDIDDTDTAAGSILSGAHGSSESASSDSGDNGAIATDAGTGALGASSGGSTRESRLSDDAPTTAGTRPLLMGASTSATPAEEQSAAVGQELRDASVSPRPDRRSAREEGTRGSGLGGASVEIRTTRSESPSAGRRRGGGGLSVLRNTWQGLMSGRSAGRGNRGRGTTGAAPMRSESAPVRIGPLSPTGDAAVRTRQHQSATARWSNTAEGAPSTTGADTNTGGRAGTDATRSVSSSSTSTGRLAADVLSHPPTVSAESDFSISDVFAGQGAAVSPAGLAAAAAASSAADLFQSAGGTPSLSRPVSATATTPRARVAPGDRFGTELAPATGGIRSPRVSSPRAAGGSVLSAVAAAAAETAEEEERKGKSAEGDAGSGAAGVFAATAVSGSPQRAGEQEGRERDRRAQQEAKAAASGVPTRSEPRPVATESPTPPADADHSDESPPSMRGTALPARLAIPQALVSPTTPPPGESTFQAADPTRAGGAGGRPGVLSIGLPSELESETGAGETPGLVLSPSAVMLSPGTDSDRGSSPSPTTRHSPEARRGGDSLDLGEKDESDDGDAPPDVLGLSPWVTTREGLTEASGGKQQERSDAARTPRRISDDSTGIGARDSVGSSVDLSPQTSGPRTASLSPDSAATSAAGAGRGAAGMSAAPGPRPTVSMGGTGAAEARGGLLAARAGTRRPLGALDLMQVVGTFSDSESPTDSGLAATPSSGSATPTLMRSPRAAATAATAASGGILSPGRPAILSDETGDRPASPISVVPFDAPSPLPRIVTGPIGSHFSSGATPLSGLTGLGGLPALGAGHSPGVESTREYSESDEDAPDTPGDLMGERLIP